MAGEGSLGMQEINYVLVTAARDEEAFIGATINSVVAQTVQPKLWVIANDGSKDATAEVVAARANEYPFIRLLNVAQNRKRDFASKAYAIEEAVSLVQNAGVEWDFLGNLDADITLDPGYFERMIGRFVEDPKLGLAGGWIQEENKGRFRDRPFNNIHSVPGAIQLFRRACFEKTGTYPALPYGGEDWYLEVRARHFGWRVRSFPEERVFHNRPTGQSDGSLLRQRFREGRQAYSLGSHPLYEFLKSIRRISEHPYMIGSVSRFLGYFMEAVHRRRPEADRSFVTQLRDEQMRRFFGVRLELGDT